MPKPEEITESAPAFAGTAAQLASRETLTPDSREMLSAPGPDYVALDEEPPPRFSLISIALFLALVVGFLLRLAAAQHLSSHVDESASILAAQMVAEKGAPIFPSGILYLQGATISYLLAPVIAAGYGGIEHLTELRMLSVLVSTATILVIYLFAKSLTRSVWVGFAIAAMLAVDPVSVRWGAMVRMYALLQFLTIVMLFMFFSLLRRPATRRKLVGFVAVFWLCVFTHIATCLVLPPMLFLAVWQHRLNLIGRRFDLSIAMAGACAAPATLLFLNRLVTPPQATSTSDTGPSISFVGDYLISASQILRPTAASWLLLFRYAESGVIIPMVMLGLSVLLVGRYFLDGNLPASKHERRHVLTFLLFLYWIPILFVAALASEHNERYLIHLHPLGMILLGFGAQELLWKERAAVAVRFAPGHTVDASAAASPILVWGDRLAPRVQWLTWTWIRNATTIGILLVGGTIRLIGLNRLSLWLDEAFSLLYSKQDWSAAAGFNGFYSPHPPLYFLMTKVANIVLPDATAGRVLSALFGVLALPVFYQLARRLLDQVAAIVATGVFTLNPIHVYYSQEARMYSMVVLFVTLSFLALIAFDQSGRRRWAVIYGFALAVAVYADYSSLFVLGPQALVVLFLTWRNPRRMVPILIAAGLAIVAYAPWLPQVWQSVSSANEDERREDYLGTGVDRLYQMVVRLAGISADAEGAYFPSLREVLWERLPEIHIFVLIAMAPVVVLGFVGLWRRWAAMAVTFSFIGCIAVAILVSLISPGLAERTILSAVVGWSLLLGAAFNGRVHRERTSLAAASLFVILALCLGTIQTIHGSAVKQQFDRAAADLAMVAPTNFPVITFSYGEVADTVIEAYEPGLLDSMRVITIRDGELEKTLSNDALPKTGITVADVTAGKLQELLPDTPENELVWYFWYFRRGEELVRQGLEQAGYSELMHRIYDAPRGRVYLDLYARDTADLGQPLSGLPDFNNRPAWGIPVGGQLVVPGEDGTSVQINNRSAIGAAVAPQIAAEGGGVYSVEVNIVSRLPGSRLRVKLGCLTSTGVSLESETAGTFSVPINNSRLHRSAIVCPDETASIRVTLQNTGRGEATFANLVVRSLPIPRR
jgi:mannosyltransferase